MVREVVRLKVEDIDTERMMIHIRQGKGRNDRYTILSEVALKALRKYAAIEKQSDWLFPTFLCYTFIGRGADLRYIQESLGHKSSKTTEIYTHISNRSLSKMQSPLDRLLGE